jgi:tetratricopeptide (TPR) repeat protein
VEEARSFTAADLSTRAKLPPELIELLALFDVIEPDRAGRFGFRDLKSAIQAARLLDSTSLSNLVFACSQIRDILAVSSPLSELTLQSEADGRIVLGAGDQVADITGQFRLGLTYDAPAVSVLLTNAEEARETGDVEQSVQLLRRALAASPKSLDTLFELGSLLCEQAEFAEGLALLRKATILRPKFADAWYNIGHALERQGRRADARDAYERAISADPAYPDPLYNLGMIALDEGRFAETIAHLERYLSLDDESEWSGRARKALSLARMSLVKAAG